MAKKSQIISIFRESKLPKPAALSQEVAKPDATGVTGLSPVRTSVATSLTPEGLASLLRRADRGDVAAYFTLASEIEEREPQVATVLSTRKLAVTSLPVQVEAASEDAHDVAIAEHVEQLVAKPEFEGLMLDLLDGIMKGFSAVEVIWERDGSSWMPARYEYRDQRHFCFDAETLSTPRLRSLGAPVDGVELQHGKWVVHKPKLRSGIPLQTGLLRPLAVCYAAKRFSLQQLLTFLEVYTMPVRLGKYPSHMVDKKKELLAAVRQIGTDCAAVVPSEMEVTFVETKSASGNVEVYLGTAAYWDGQISKVVLGASLTSEASGPQGTGTQSLGNVHNEVRKDLRNSDARQLAATINAQLVQVFVDLNYGPQKAYPKVTIDTSDPEDRKTLVEIAKTAVELGVEIEMSSFRDRLGFPEPAPGAQLLRAPVAAPPPGMDADEEDEDEDDEEDEQDDFEEAREENRTTAQPHNVQAFAVRNPGDVITELVDEALQDHWRELLDPAVGETLRRAQAATSFDDMTKVLSELEGDEGDVLDIEKLTRSLAKYTFAARGAGSATDDLDG